MLIDYIKSQIKFWAYRFFQEQATRMESRVPKGNWITGLDQYEWVTYIHVHAAL